MAKTYVKFQVSEEIQNKALEALEVARDTGKIKKGSNEATKAIERSIASLVLIGADVEPEEIVMHLPPLCEEKKIPFVFINKQNDIGTASGLDVGSAAAAIVKPGKAKDMIDEIVKQVSDLRA
ncbi:MAG: 50S ribosomal protein L7Ae [Methanoregulaceae archaeon PtaB.Bin108]|nr:MAG: 50S ribosomal protein L7Ae [Methanoregulaceae archaeon PtaB.Bin108]OPY44197.1 MAG: 50S ribosomal protein L7Ae [Methanoregulaceae archaeon PtaU1.Bin222]